MYVWSKRLVGVLLGIFVGLSLLLLVQGVSESGSELKSHTVRWMAINYVGLVAWIFVWMIDQARVRGKNVWLWLVPVLVAPLPALMGFVLFLQRRIRPVAPPK